ncbi:hypothetical protein PanWU01x14_088770 [Parasponia andersonii]|uniref:Uncharacterized protein n=1 Tax=Parasponia andersonii TaxID=3476 RepID=A0A2P5D847_PARAD|nr:hypothetical protein PanWU01x14_088770 [Parasponia andersonii]
MEKAQILLVRTTNGIVWAQKSKPSRKWPSFTHTLLTSRSSRSSTDGRQPPNFGETPNFFFFFNQILNQERYHLP